MMTLTTSLRWAQRIDNAIEDNRYLNGVLERTSSNTWTWSENDIIDPDEDDEPITDCLVTYLKDELNVPEAEWDIEQNKEEEW
jgi:hypothetical protein